MRATSPHDEQHGQRRPPGAVVLVVEDDPEINELERQLLAARGLESVGVLAGPEAVAAAREQDFAAVLLDLMLPGMDGFETCRRLQRISTAPIVILTALDSDECRQRGEACGASAYFTKPFDPDEVISALWELIGARGGPRSNGEPRN
jgi:DNA-binding response OmpR family regulator